MLIARCPKCGSTHHCYIMNYSVKKSDGSLMCIYDNEYGVVYTNPEFGFSCSSEDVINTSGPLMFCVKHNMYIPASIFLSFGKSDSLSDGKIDF